MKRRLNEQQPPIPASTSLSTIKTTTTTTTTTKQPPQSNTKQQQLENPIKRRTIITSSIEPEKVASNNNNNKHTITTSTDGNNEGNDNTESDKGLEKDGDEQVLKKRKVLVGMNFEKIFNTKKTKGRKRSPSVASQFDASSPVDTTTKNAKRQTGAATKSKKQEKQPPHNGLFAKAKSNALKNKSSKIRSQVSVMLTHQNLDSSNTTVTLDNIEKFRLESTLTKGKAPPNKTSIIQSQQKGTFEVNIESLDSHSTRPYDLRNPIDKALLKSVKSRLSIMSPNSLDNSHYDQENGDQNEQEGEENDTNKKKTGKNNNTATKTKPNENTFLDSTIKAWHELTEGVRSKYFPEDRNGKYTTNTNNSTNNTTEESIDSNGNLSSSVPLLVPNIPCLSRKPDIMNFLRAPVLEIHERPCLMGDMCESIALWHHYDTKAKVKWQRTDQRKTSGGLPSEAFVLREFLLPADIALVNKRCQEGLSMKEAMAQLQPRACIICNRMLTDLLSNAQKSGIERQQWLPLQNHCNKFDEPGEYKKSRCMKGCGSEFSGIHKPIVCYDREHYLLGYYNVWSTDEYNNNNNSTQNNSSKKGEKKKENRMIRSISTFAKFEKDKYSDGNDDHQKKQSRRSGSDEDDDEDDDDEGDAEEERVIKNTLQTTSLKVYKVAGWIEHEDIIYQPGTDSPYVKSVVNIIDRQDTALGLPRRKTRQFARGCYSYPLTLGRVFGKILTFPSFGSAISTELFTSVTKGSWKQFLLLFRKNSITEAFEWLSTLLTPFLKEKGCDINVKDLYKEKDILHKMDTIDQCFDHYGLQTKNFRRNFPSKQHKKSFQPTSTRTTDTEQQREKTMIAWFVATYLLFLIYINGVRKGIELFSKSPANDVTLPMGLSKQQANFKLQQQQEQQSNNLSSSSSSSNNLNKRSVVLDNWYTGMEDEDLTSFKSTTTTTTTSRTNNRHMDDIDNTMNVDEGDCKEESENGEESIHGHNTNHYHSTGTANLIKKKGSMLSYLEKQMCVWENFHIPLVKELKAFFVVEEDTPPNMDIPVRSNLLSILENITEQLESYVCPYTVVMDRWCALTENTIKPTKTTSSTGHGNRNMIEWIKSPYLLDHYNCFNILQHFREYEITTFSKEEQACNDANISTFPMQQKTQAIKFYALPTFDETLHCISGMCYAKRNATFQAMKADNPATMTCSRCCKCQVIKNWFQNEIWKQNPTVTCLFTNFHSPDTTLKMPVINNHSYFWSVLFCIERISTYAQKHRRETRNNIASLERGCFKKNAAIPIWDKLCDQTPPPRFNEVLDHAMQTYLSCFLEITDWFLDKMNQSISVEDTKVPLAMLYPHPDRALSEYSLPDISPQLQKVRFWHDAVPSKMAIVTLLEKATHYRSHGRSMGKLVLDCCQNSQSVTGLIKALSTLSIMGLYKNPIIEHVTKKDDHREKDDDDDDEDNDENIIKHKSLPVTYRPDFNTMYWAWRLFFDRRIDNIVHGKKLTSFVQMNVQKEPPVAMDEEENENSKNRKESKKKSETAKKKPTQNNKKKQTTNPLPFAREEEMRKTVYDERKDGLCFISNDILLLHFQTETKLCNNLVKEFTIHSIKSLPQYWLSLKAFNHNAVAADEKNVDSSSGRSIPMVDKKWMDYFTKTQITCNFYRFCLERELGGLKKLLVNQLPWKQDALASKVFRIKFSQNHSLKQFDRFYGNRVYPFPKQTLPMALYSHIDHHLEESIKTSIYLEQDIVLIKHLLDALYPQKKLLDEKLLNGNYRPNVRDVLVLCLKLIDQEIYNYESQLTPLSEETNKNPISFFTDLLKKRQKLHRALKSPLADEYKEMIWKSIMGNVANDSMEEKRLAQKMNEFFVTLHPDTITVLYNVTILHDMNYSPKRIAKEFKNLPLSSLKPLHFLLDTICTAYSIQTANLDLDSTLKIHESLLARFKRVEPIQTLTSKVYRIFYTFCCNRMASVNKNSQMFGHSYIIYSRDAKQYLCGKKKSKRSIPTSSNNTTTTTTLLLENTKTLALKNTSRTTTASNKKKQHTHIDIKSKKKPKEMSKFEFNLLKEAVIDGTNNDEDEDEEEEKAEEDCYFTNIAKNNGLKTILNIPSKELTNHIDKILKTPTTISENESEEEEEDKIDELYKSLVSFEQFKQPQQKNFKTIGTKEQNMIVRRLKKMRGLECSTHPPAACLNAFGKRIYHGKDEKKKKVYQHCLKCGNFTDFSDECWGAEYQCFRCWLESLVVICRCSFCHQIKWNTLEKQMNQQANKEKMAYTSMNNMSSSSSSSSGSTDFLTDNTYSFKSIDPKFNKKRSKNTMKLKWRNKILMESLHTPTYPMCLTTLSRVERKNILSSKAGVNIPDEVNNPSIESLPSGLLPCTELSSGARGLSTTRTDIPCMYNMYFCSHHQPLNLSVINQGGIGHSTNNFDASKNNHLNTTPVLSKNDDNLTNHTKQSGISTHPPRYYNIHRTSFLLTTKNFNINNSSRISFMDVYWNILSGKKKRPWTIGNNHNNSSN